MLDDGSAILKCPALCMCILIHNILKLLKYMVGIELQELQHNAQTDGSFHHHHHLFTFRRSLFGNNMPLDVEIVIHII
jgi:hypothetical protein